jgi:hypothetical protein
MIVTTLLLATVPALAQDQDKLPSAKPVPAMQVIPLSHDRASFRKEGRELTRFHFAPNLKRPFWHPLIGPSGRSHTRMGHPHDPKGHSHHNSVWISHQNVNGINFWEDRAGKVRIEHLRVEQYFDSQQQARMLSSVAWKDGEGKILMNERRRACITPLEKGEWLMEIDLQLEAPKGQTVELGKTPFGIIGVRMAKTIGVRDGGGRILNSEGKINEKPIFRKPTKWVDYSGPITAGDKGGITLMDHPSNPDHPTPFHVRNDGWMGACLTLNHALKIEPGKPLRLRYGLWIHEGVPNCKTVEKQWKAFSKIELPAMTRKKR